MGNVTEQAQARRQAKDTRENVYDLHSEGKELYKKKNYEAALKCFNTAILKCRSPHIDILDNRAAVYTKLENLDAALRDGRRMIQMAKTEVTGYLRSGQILALMGKNEAALGIYNYGIGNLSMSVKNEDVKVLQGMVKKLTAKISASKQHDPFVVLPLELIQIVLHQLSFTNILSIRGVSRSWKRLLESIPNLWYHLDLSGAKRQIRLGFVKDCIRYSQYRLKRASLSHCGLGDMCQGITEYISRCQGLEHIDIHRNTGYKWLLTTSHPLKRLTSLILGHEHSIYLSEVAALLAKYTSLQRAEFYSVCLSNDPLEWRHDLYQLKVLKLHCNRGKINHQFPVLDRLKLDDLFTKALHVVELDLADWPIYGLLDFRALIHLEVLNLGISELHEFPLLNPWIRRLSLPGLCIGSGSGQTIKNARLSDLEYLHACLEEPAEVRHLLPLLSPSKGKLRVLHLEVLLPAYSEYGPTVFQPLIASGVLSELTVLNLVSLPVSDDVARLLAENMPRLRTLSLDRSYITGIGVKALVLKQGDKLETLSVRECTKLSHDAVKWARSKGISIISGSSDNIKYQKKIPWG